jgi:hypothetical protein
MADRMRTGLVVMLCLIAFTQTACVRRTGRVRLPFMAGVSSSHKSPRSPDSTNRVRDAIGSLKNRVESENAGGGTTDEGTRAPALTSLRGATAGDPKRVGTSGALSVENQYPATPPSASSSGPPPRNHVLSRAGSLVRRAGGGTWTAMLCLIAGALFIALVLRRSRTTT